MINYFKNSKTGGFLAILGDLPEKSESFNPKDFKKVSEADYAAESDRVMKLLTGMDIKKGGPVLSEPPKP